ncbi:peptidoglycan recognition protein family protein [Enterococcus massiliensis]|uniref:peptidoglycan recognition protein family protein n=1 Tax=Enterococcus massiliensis TaxID=1640685 RepID=UPI000AE549FF|nr:N-acetylmuramoyl-L-alanine amidase [Enterococcus massiliensis]
MTYKVEKQIRQGLPQVGVLPYGQVHAHSTGNPSSTAQNEADYHMRRPINSGFFSHVVGNGRVIQTAPVNRGAYDVGGGWNAWGYAQVELIESHKTKAEFLKDYKIYVELLRDLAKAAKIPIKVDSGNVGILSHAYCTAHQPNNGSDHVDPYPYLAKWGISKAQFKKDVESGKVGGTVVSKPVTKPKPAPVKPTVAQLKVDGQFGNATAKRLQQYLKTTADGIISHQYKQKYNQNIYAAQFDKTLIGSNVIVALQKWLKVEVDGLFGKATVIALQKRLGTTADGVISPVSDCIKEMQRRLNKNKL